MGTRALSAHKDNWENVFFFGNFKHQRYLSQLPSLIFWKIQNFLIWIFFEKMHKLTSMQPLRHNECIISLFRWQRINDYAWNMQHRWKIRNMVGQSSINIISKIVCHQFVQKMKTCFEFYKARRRRRFFGGIFGMRNLGLNFPPPYFFEKVVRGGGGSWL